MQALRYLLVWKMFPVVSTSLSNLSLACRTLGSAKKLSSGVKNAHPISLDVTDEKALDAEVAKNDLVISLIPYTFHATVIKSAIRNKKNVVTTSYVSPAKLELEDEAKKAGITVMNEIGLDPGIDHLYAIKTIEEVHKAGGKITSFLSYCGGLLQKLQITLLVINSPGRLGASCSH
jgi:saccharopine dehydrogenase (NADP+, L-glutamate forming)